MTSHFQANDGSSCTIPKDTPKGTAFETLRFELPHITAGELTRLVNDGAVYCNGERLVDDLPMPARARLELFEPRPGYRDSLQSTFDSVTESSIVYRDEHMIIAVKPSGLPTLPTRDQSSLNFKKALTLLLQRMGIDIQPHIPSRLDAPVMGLIPIAIGQPASRNLQRSMERGKIKKTYRALVSAKDARPQTGPILLPIAKTHVHAVLRVTAPHGQAAHTEIIEVQQESPGRFLLRLQPLTGRTHQLRLHCAASGFPIIGDAFYGEKDTSRNTLHLFCEQLALPHPVTNLPIIVKIPELLLPAWAK